MSEGFEWAGLISVGGNYILGAPDLASFLAENSVFSGFVAKSRATAPISDIKNL